MFYFDPMYFVVLAPGLLFSLWATYRTKTTFAKYSKVATASGQTGAQAAQRLLAQAGIRDVEVVATSGALSDHYNPLTKKLALSEPVYASRSIAAIGVACHEAGHAIQHSSRYFPLHLRSALVPTASFGSSGSYIAMIAGALLNSKALILVGVALFCAVVLFQLVTLPVEFDASRRAKELALTQGLVSPNEREGMSRVLDAAALTYVAAVVTSLLTLFYYLWRLGLLGGRRD